ncbi:hypothetical protein J4E85_011305 [Alternaria conjuncta]|uniref:uncharacterized protein n=1 Tax=Alternaria conjuncta TaxID=181017 RepID=UPI00221EE103|nr:uncharacterized protein J4E85_011305 [Alternaria conjuncta]KAI4911167.1 hypothetical protein J4E85_011305 [Alternaria conjuncta]
MSDLYFPPELVNNTISDFMYTYGFAEASLLRGVSRTWKAAIDARIAQLPIEAFVPLTNATRAILKSVRVPHLANRACEDGRVLTGERDTLPKYIKLWAGWLISTDVVSAGEEYATALMLSKQLHIACKSAWEMASYRKSSKTFQRVLPYFTDNGAGVKLAVIAAVGNLDALISTVNWYGSDRLWDVSYTFGSALAAAAGGGHRNVVEYLLAYFATNYRTHPLEQYEAAFRGAIAATLRHGNGDMSMRLLHVYHRYLPAVPKLLLNSWIAMAAKHPDDRVSVTLLHLRTEPGLRERFANFKLICKTNSKPVVDGFLRQRSMNLNQGYLEKKVAFRCLLSVAVGVGHPYPVKALLHHGAHADGVPTCRPCDLPVWLAVQGNSLEIVAALCSYGADIESIGQLWNDSDDQFKEERGAIVMHLNLVQQQRIAQWDAAMGGPQQS